MFFVLEILLQSSITLWPKHETRRAPQKVPKRPKIQFFSKWQLSSRKNSVDCNLKVLGTPDVTSVGLISLGNTTSLLFMYWLPDWFIWCIWFICWIWFICLVSLTGLFRSLDYFSGSNATAQQCFLRLCPSDISREHDHVFYMSLFFYFFEILDCFWKLWDILMKVRCKLWGQEEYIKTKATIKNESAMIASALADK